jgi:hypothetical protein
MSRCWYRRDGEALVPTGVALAPFTAGAQHGAAVAGLVARAVDSTPSPVPMAIVRLVVDLSRRVPVGRTEVLTEVRRAGRRLQTLEATVVVDGEVVGRSHALRMRHGDVVDPADITTRQSSPAPEGTPLDIPSPWSTNNVFESLDLAFERFTGDTASYWVTVDDQLVEGEAMTPATRAAVCSDFALSGAQAMPGYPATNADVVMSLNRLPTSTRIRIESIVRLNPGGWGSSSGAMSDADGHFGTVTKALLYSEKRVSA